MVSIVQNGNVQSSYAKAQQLDKSAAQAKQLELQEKRARADEPQQSRKAESASSQTVKEQDNRQFAVAQGTQGRTDEGVRDTEQARGSLVDISV